MDNKNDSKENLSLSLLLEEKHQAYIQKLIKNDSSMGRKLIDNLDNINNTIIGFDNINDLTSYHNDFIKDLSQVTNAKVRVYIKKNVDAVYNNQLQKLSEKENFFKLNVNNSNT